MLDIAWLARDLFTFLTSETGGLLEVNGPGLKKNGGSFAFLNE